MDFTATESFSVFFFLEFKMYHYASVHYTIPPHLFSPLPPVLCLSPAKIFHLNVHSSVCLHHIFCMQISLKIHRLISQMHHSVRACEERAVTRCRFLTASVSTSRDVRMHFSGLVLFTKAAAAEGETLTSRA